jgi:aminocarboxymuconate-semialdehyde decarboxylase
VLLPANVDGAYLGERKFWPLREVIRALDIAAFLHPEGRRDLWYHKFALWNSLGQSIEEAKVMASMIYEGLLDAIPGLEVVVGHGGGYFPTYMGRLDRNILKPEAVANTKGKPSAYLRHFYYDTYVDDPLALQMLFRRVGDIRSASSKRPWACRVMSGSRRRRAMARHCGAGRDSLKSIRTN